MITNTQGIQFFKLSERASAPSKSKKTLRAVFRDALETLVITISSVRNISGKKLNKGEVIWTSGNPPQIIEKPKKPQPKKVVMVIKGASINGEEKEGMKQRTYTFFPQETSNSEHLSKTDARFLAQMSLATRC